MTLTGATPVQYSRRGFAENRKYQATGNGPRSVRRVSIIRRPITVRPVPPAVRYARVREGGRRKTETIPGALDGRLDGDYRALTRFKNSVCRGRGRNRNARPSPAPGRAIELAETARPPDQNPRMPETLPSESMYGSRLEQGWSMQAGVGRGQVAARVLRSVRKERRWDRVCQRSRHSFFPPFRRFASNLTT